MSMAGKSKAYLTTLSSNENGKMLCKEEETFISILSLVDEKGLDGAISELRCPPFMVDEIIKHRSSLEKYFGINQ